MKSNFFCVCLRFEDVFFSHEMKIYHFTFTYVLYIYSRRNCHKNWHNIKTFLCVRHSQFSSFYIFHIFTVIYMWPIKIYFHFYEMPIYYNINGTFSLFACESLYYIIFIHIHILAWTISKNLFLWVFLDPVHISLSVC